VLPLLSSFVLAFFKFAIEEAFWGERDCLVGFDDPKLALHMMVRMLGQLALFRDLCLALMYPKYWHP
jgi:hypothetical protein